jgi:hypothetical protein
VSSQCPHNVLISVVTTASANQAFWSNLERHCSADTQLPRLRELSFAFKVLWMSKLQSHYLDPSRVAKVRFHVRSSQSQRFSFGFGPQLSQHHLLSVLFDMVNPCPLRPLCIPPSAPSERLPPSFLPTWPFYLTHPSLCSSHSVSADVLCWKHRH